MGNRLFIAFLKPESNSNDCNRSPGCVESLSLALTEILFSAKRHRPPRNKKSGLSRKLFYRWAIRDSNPWPTQCK